MRTLAFDGRMGASGDMLLGALIAAGADPAVLDTVEKRLDVEYRVGETTRAGISATDVRVVRPDSESDESGKTVQPRDEEISYEGDSHSHEHGEHGHSHSHGEHDHSHGHGEDDHSHGHGEDDHSHSHDGSHTDDEDAERTGPHRSYPEVIEIVESMALPDGVESDAKAVFELLGRAEASVHGTDLDATHFHEVGADDAIADVVGVALLLDDLGPERIVTGPAATGAGDVEISHGVYPVPTPAVVELLTEADWSTRGGPVESELLTPTGAAILAHFAAGVDRLPTMDTHAVGYGAGNKSFGAHPNVLRAVLGESTEDLARDPVTVLETNVDDATPEELGGLQETLSEVGALDVSILPATMKKSRPGHLIKVIVKPGDADRVARRLALETGTLGVREHGRGHRLIADRETDTVEVEASGETVDICVKIARLGDTVFDVSAEFDDALAAAESTGGAVPVRDLMRRAERTAKIGRAHV